MVQMRALNQYGLLAVVAVCAGCVATPTSSTVKAESPAAASMPQRTFSDTELSAKYYYDLGPAKIDASNYPQNQQKNYALFAKTCSQCHTLARPINSPRESYVAWKFY